MLGLHKAQIIITSLKPNHNHFLSIPMETISSSVRVSRRWSDLSHDLLLSIFSGLNNTDIILGVSAVCSPWRAAARNPQFWRILDFSDWDSIRIRAPGCFNQFLRRVLGFVKGIEEVVEKVYLPSIANGQDMILVSSRLPELSYLSFTNPDANHAEICSALCKFSYLQGLTINLSLISTDTISCLEKFPVFSELKLLSEGEEKSLDVVIAAQICMNLQRLRKLEMQDVIVPALAFVWLIEGLEKLEYLDILGNDMLKVEKEVMEKIKRLKVFIC